MQGLIKKRTLFLDYVLLIIGTALVAVSVQCIYDPLNMVTGGFSGLAIVVKDLTKGPMNGGIPLWFTNLVLNVPIFLAAFKIKGKKFILRTTIATLMLSGWLYILPPVDLSQGDFVLAAIFGGLLGGAGMGLVLLAKATTGGTDMLAALIQHYMRQYSVVQVIQVMDGEVDRAYDPETGLNVFRF